METKHTPATPLPRITRAGDQYRIEGTPTSEEWLKSLRPGRAPWCEFRVNGDQLTSYGGEVWPTAWPELFEAIPPSVYYGCAGIRLTDQGRALLRELGEE